MCRRCAAVLKGSTGSSSVPESRRQPAGPRVHHDGEQITVIHCTIFCCISCSRMTSPSWAASNYFCWMKNTTPKMNGMMFRLEILPIIMLSSGIEIGFFQYQNRSGSTGIPKKYQKGNVLGWIELEDPVEPALMLANDGEEEAGVAIRTGIWNAIGRHPSIPAGLAPSSRHRRPVSCCNLTLS